MATELERIRAKAQAEPQLVFTSLYHHVYDEDNLRACFERLKAKKATGIDGVTKKAYGERLEENLRNLSARLRRMGYVPPPSRRVYVEKPGSAKKRLLGISCFEAKLVESALKQVLEPIFEVGFQECSYGYRPGRTAHQAVDAVGRCIQQHYVNYVVEADIKGFFDHLNHEWLLKFLGHRVGDKRVLRLVARFLKAGILEDGLVHPTDEGAPQGGILSPLLSNIYLHYVLDLWFEVRKGKMFRGEAHLFRYADDFLACFRYESDALRFRWELQRRLEQFHLEIEPSKTQLLAFGRFAQENAQARGEKAATFDFLGFTFYCGQTRYGSFKVKRLTAKKKFRHKLKEIGHWLRQTRSRAKVGRIIATAKRKLQGHLNYYAITDNIARCGSYAHQLRNLLFKWLNRQSQRRSYTWDGFNQLLEHCRWPKVWIKVQLDPFRRLALV